MWAYKGVFFSSNRVARLSSAYDFRCGVTPCGLLLNESCVFSGIHIQTSRPLDPSRIFAKSARACMQSRPWPDMGVLTYKVCARPRHPRGGRSMGALWLLGSVVVAMAVAGLTYVAALPDQPEVRRRRRSEQVQSTPELVPSGLATLTGLGVLRVLLGAPTVSLLDAVTAIAAVWASVRRLINGLFVLSCIGLCLVAVRYSRLRGGYGRAGQAHDSNRRDATTGQKQLAVSGRTVRLSPSGARLFTAQSCVVGSSSMGQDLMLSPIIHSNKGSAGAWQAPPGDSPRARPLHQHEQALPRRLHSDCTSKVIFRSVPRHQSGQTHLGVRLSQVQAQAHRRTPEPEPEPELRSTHAAPRRLQLVPLGSSTPRALIQQQLDFAECSGSHSPVGPRSTSHIHSVVLHQAQEALDERSPVRSEMAAAVVDGVVHVSHARPAELLTQEGDAAAKMDCQQQQQRQQQQLPAELLTQEGTRREVTEGVPPTNRHVQMRQPGSMHG